MLSRDDLQDVLRQAIANGGDFADIFIERKKTTGIGCEDDKIERINSGIDVGAGIRVISGEATAYAYTNDISREGLMKAAKIVSHAAGENKRDITFNLTEVKPVVDFEFQKVPDTVPTDDKVALVLQANKTAREYDKRIKQVAVGVGDVMQQVTIANTLGNYVEDERVRTRFMINTVGASEGVIQTGYNAVGGLVGYELFDEFNPEDVAREAAGRAIKMLEAQPAPAGKMPVVMAAEAGGTMVHEACGHGLEADLVQKRLSVYANKKGEQVAADIVTVIDDATIKNKYGSFRFDDEGERGQKTVLIKDGELVEYMYDRLTAMKEKRESTGNGRRESYQDKPIPRMTNTYIAPGKDDPEKIIKSIENGLLVKKMGGGQVNTTNGDFVFDVAEGYLIRDGQVVAPVRGATLTGNGPEVLKIVDMVGNDLGYTIGTCGKDGQGVPVSDAQPTMRIPEIVVGGTGVSDGPTIRRIRRI
ncbi:peptidase U62 modulator of DNA gyrase [Thermincola ferriacetica]|uniref:Peptidase U62 modulator of DNA gyrase n=1 Tax=Thermincola ferriacetica TaxID=281456 RepID=A0A0L6W5E9_9FIRM|nr:TldD/PmbA family protein [Thermincola ferriacetica]KNZ70696.1 peptidase U62 modulator of DNA gyrase [Thermincola ferriacetica]